MAESRFVYVTYIRTTPEKLWQALIDPEFTRRFWVETWQESEWKPGASWRMMCPDGRVGNTGEVLECELDLAFSLSLLRMPCPNRCSISTRMTSLYPPHPGDQLVRGFFRDHLPLDSALLLQ